MARRDDRVRNDVEVLEAMLDMEGSSRVTNLSHFVEPSSEAYYESVNVWFKTDKRSELTGRLSELLGLEN